MEMQFHKVSKVFDGKTVLSDLDWTLRSGEIWRIEGASGVGKTTLLRLLMGLERPTGGEIDGSARFSAVFQENRLLPRLSARRNIQIVSDRSAEEIDRQMARVLEPETLSQPVETLSGGMQRRVAVMRALLAPSDVIVMDEPFTGLDEENVNRVSEVILSLRGSRALVLVSHGTPALFSAAQCLRLD